jgi:hypothetical protein
MKKIKKGSLAILLAAVMSFLMVFPALAADYTYSGSGSDAAGATLGIGMIICYILALIVGLVIYIWVALWIAKDANKRGAPAALWVILWILFSWVGLIIYLVARPKEEVGSGTKDSVPPPPPPAPPADTEG